MTTTEYDLAKWMHEQYEEIAIAVGWRTQKSCRVEFKDLPKENKKVMIEIAKRTQDKLMKEWDVR